MKFIDLTKQTSEWLKGTGPDSDIVMSSRIRLARNMRDVPFPHWANNQQLEEVYERAAKAFSGDTYLKKGLLSRMKELSAIDKQFLVERHLVSREHIARADHKGILITPDESIAIMVNEEDHLRLQVMKSGLNLNEAWVVADRLDDFLSTKLNFAGDPEWGSLTTCPTNTGTGMRSSIMLHLPCLVMTKEIGRILQAITKLGLTARGLFGEGTEASGNFFQFSNQVTLGRRELDIIDNLNRIARQLISHEQNARRAIHRRNRLALEDRIYRALGTLEAARIITSRETIELLSLVRLGVDIGIVKDINRGVVNELFIIIQPGHLQKIAGRILSPAERDLYRAKLIREKLIPK